MSYALQRVATELRADLEKWGIEVNPEARVIVVNGMARQYKMYTEAREYRRDLKQAIKTAKLEAKKHANDNQANLFGGEL